MKKPGLSNNQLKILAMVCMTADHVGYALLPHVLWLRIAGRLAFPIYAFMIAEGCRHTRSLPRYFGAMAILAVICQAVYFVAMDSLYMCVLVTFSLSILLIGLLKQAEKNQSAFSYLLFLAGLGSVLFVCQKLPGSLPGTDFSIDYGFIGVMLPVCLYAVSGRSAKAAVLLLCMAALAMTDQNTLQWYGILAVPLLALYNGKRGTKKLKWFFYLFYPVHLALIQLIVCLIK